MGFFKKPITTSNIEEKLADVNWKVSSSTGEMVPIYFLVMSFNISQRINDLNFSGVVNYSIDSDFGGGPATVSTVFDVVDGELNVELDSINFDDLLDMDVIDDNAELEVDEDFDDLDDWN